MVKRRQAKAVTVLLAATLLCAGIGSTALAGQGSGEDLAGTWVGPSLDVTYNIAGELTAQFEARAGQTFAGTVYAFYPDFGVAETCTITGGTIKDDQVSMTVLCYFPGYPQPSAATIDATLDSTGDVMNGTFRGAPHDEGYFTLVRQ